MSNQSSEKKNPGVVEIDFGSLGIEGDEKPVKKDSESVAPASNRVAPQGAPSKPQDRAKEGKFELPELELSIIGAPATEVREETLPKEQPPVASAALPASEVAPGNSSTQTSGLSDLVRETFRPIEEVKAAYGSAESNQAPVGAGEGDTAFIDNGAGAVPNFSLDGGGPPTAPSIMPMSMPPPVSLPLSGLNLSDVRTPLGFEVNPNTSFGQPTDPSLSVQNPVPMTVQEAAAPITVSRADGSSASASVFSQAEERPANPVANSPFSEAAVPVASASRRDLRRPAILGGLAFVLLAAVGYFLYPDEISNLIFGSSSEVTATAPSDQPFAAVDAPIVAPTAAPAKAPAAAPAKSVTKVAVKSAPTPTATKGEPVAPVPLKSYLASRNRQYFSAVDVAIDRGEPNEAIRVFRSPLNAALTNDDKIIAAEMEARYYLLVGNVGKAIDALSPHCGSPVVSKFATCAHYVRALISARRFEDARKYIDWAEKSPGLDAFKLHKVVLSLGLRAMSIRMADTSRALFTNVVSELNVPAEWHRQRIVWFARGFLKLDKPEKQDVLNAIFVSRRESSLNSLLALEKTSVGVNEGFLASFLNYWSIRFEMKSFSELKARNTADSDYARAGRLFALLPRTFQENSQTVGTALTGFVGRPVFEEISSLVSANIALNDGNSRRAWQIMSRELARVRSKKMAFGYEWSLIFGRCAAAEKGTENLRVARREMEVAAKETEFFKSDVFFWLVKAKLELESGTRGDASFEAARKLAYGLYEKGLVVSEEAKRLRAFSRVKEAAMLLHNSFASIPDHGVLLQTAAEITPLIGANPQIYLDAYSKIPEQRALRGVEVLPLSEETMRKLLEQI